jgi:uncharacterized membrane protein
MGYPTQIVMTPMKSVRTAIVLAALFGPLGMFYTTLWGAVIMLVISLIVVPLTLGFGLIIILPACAFWAALAARSYNQKLLSRQAAAQTSWLRPGA